MKCLVWNLNAEYLLETRQMSAVILTLLEKSIAHSETLSQSILGVEAYFFACALKISYWNISDRPDEMMKTLPLFVFGTQKFNDTQRTDEAWTGQKVFDVPGNMVSESFRTYQSSHGYNNLNYSMKKEAQQLVKTIKKKPHNLRDPIELLHDIIKEANLVKKLWYIYELSLLIFNYHSVLHLKQTNRMLAIGMTELIKIRRQLPPTDRKQINGCQALLSSSYAALGQLISSQGQGRISLNSNESDCFEEEDDLVVSAMDQMLTEDSKIYLVQYPDEIPNDLKTLKKIALRSQKWNERAIELYEDCKSKQCCINDMRPLIAGQIEDLTKLLNK